MSLILKIASKKRKVVERPSYIEPEVYCNSCQAIIRESLKILRHRTSEMDVYNIFLNIK